MYVKHSTPHLNRRMILGLHGFRQNGTILQSKLERLGLSALCPDGH